MIYFQKWEWDCDHSIHTGDHMIKWLRVTINFPLLDEMALGESFCRKWLSTFIVRGVSGWRKIEKIPMFKGFNHIIAGKDSLFICI